MLTRILMVLERVRISIENNRLESYINHLCIQYIPNEMFILYILGRMFLVGLSQGPPHHYWYIWLDKLLPKRNLKTVIYNQQCFINEYQILNVLLVVFTLSLFLYFTVYYSRWV